MPFSFFFPFSPQAGTYHLKTYQQTQVCLSKPKLFLVPHFFLKNKIKYDIDRNKYRNSIMECKQKQKSIVSSFFNFCVHFIRLPFLFSLYPKIQQEFRNKPKQTRFLFQCKWKGVYAAGVQEDQDAVCRDVMLFIWSVLRGDVIRIDCQGGFVASSYVS